MISASYGVISIISMISGMEYEISLSAKPLSVAIATIMRKYSESYYYYS